MKMRMKMMNMLVGGMACSKCHKMTMVVCAVGGTSFKGEGPASSVTKESTMCTQPGNNDVVKIHFFA